MTRIGTGTHLDEVGRFKAKDGSANEYIVVMYRAIKYGQIETSPQVGVFLDGMALRYMTANDKREVQKIAAGKYMLHTDDAAGAPLRIPLTTDDPRAR